LPALAPYFACRTVTLPCDHTARNDMDDLLSRRAFLGAVGASSLAPALAAGEAFPIDRVPVISRELWQWVHSQLVLEPGIVWLDTARFGPTLRAVMAREYRSRERESLDFTRYQAATFGPESIRLPLAAIGEFLGADPADLVLTAGTAEGLGIIAQGLDLQAGDEVLTTTHDHPAAVYPWLVQAKRRGIKLVQLPQDGVPVAPETILARFAGALTAKTKVIAFCHVQYTDGTLMPVREICALARSKGILSVVDGAQAPGLVDFRITELGCDAYATCFHKWLNGPYGSGTLYVNRDLRARLWPLAADSAAGWDINDRFGSLLPAGVDGLNATAQSKLGQFARYRGPAIDALPLAFELQQAASRARIAARIRELAAYLRPQLERLPQAQVLTPAHPALWSGIIALRLGGHDHAALAQALAREDGIVVGRVQHGTAFDALRVSVHASNEMADVDRFVMALQRRL